MRVSAANPAVVGGPHPRRSRKARRDDHAPHLVQKANGRSASAYAMEWPLPSKARRLEGTRSGRHSSKRLRAGTSLSPRTYVQHLVHLHRPST
jgi:hypothetical protein